MQAAPKEHKGRAQTAPKERPSSADTAPQQHPNTPPRIARLRVPCVRQKLLRACDLQAVATARGRLDCVVV
eukprot:2861021-Lingulodinium_polyedra.AAC.1